MAMLFVATQNFRGVDRLLEDPSGKANHLLDRVGPEKRALLRYQVSELNRFFFEIYGNVQIGLALVLTITVAVATRANRLVLGIAAGLLVISVAARVFLIPEIAALGRLIDFVPTEAPSPERSRFWSFHIAFSVLEIAKFLLIAAAAGWFLIRRENRRSRTTSTHSEHAAAA